MLKFFSIQIAFLVLTSLIVWIGFGWYIFENMPEEFLLNIYRKNAYLVSRIYEVYPVIFLGKFFGNLFYAVKDSYFRQNWIFLTIPYLILLTLLVLMLDFFLGILLVLPLINQFF